MCSLRNQLLVAIVSLAFVTSASEAVRNACESMIVSNLSATAVSKVFNTETAEVSQYLLETMNRMGQRGEVFPEDVMRHLMGANPAKSIEWLLDNYTNFSSVGRANMASSLRHSQCNEAYELIGFMLKDKAVVTNRNSMALAPIPLSGYREYFRVCDFAYGSLLDMRMENGDTPAGLPLLFSYSTRIEERDKSINILKEWWTANAGSILKEKKSVAEERPAIKEKVMGITLKHSRNE